MNQKENLDLCDKIGEAVSDIILNSNIDFRYLVPCFTGLIWATISQLGTKEQIKALMNINHRLIEMIEQQQKPKC
jgi:hypothetical protein